MNPYRSQPTTEPPKVTLWHRFLHWVGLNQETVEVLEGYNREAIFRCSCGKTRRYAVPQSIDNGREYPLFEEIRKAVRPLPPALSPDSLILQRIYRRAAESMQAPKTPLPKAK